MANRIITIVNQKGGVGKTTTVINLAHGLTPNLETSGADKRWARVWDLDVNDAGTAGGNVNLTFDISDAGGNAGAADFDSGGTYFLLGQAAGSTDNFTPVSYDSWSVSGDSITFTVNADQLGSEFTVGGITSSPTAVTVQSFGARSSSSLAYLAVIPLVLVVGVAAVVVKRKRR